MTIFITLAAILQSFSISLGVGSSTLAITNFFAAIADGTIDETERRMMGIVYVVLRVAMMGILLFMVSVLGTMWFMGADITTPDILAEALVVAVLFINAVLMTKHLVPSTIGPGVQAGSWYTLGTIQGLTLVGIQITSFVTFLLAYAAWLALAVGIVNGIMAILRSKKQSA